MKRLLLIISIVIGINISLIAQSPQKFNYQAVVRDNVGAVIKNQIVSFRIAIVKNNASGSEVYAETHTITTNDFGLVNLEVGGGTIISGSMASIDWGADIYFIKIGLDINGGNNYTLMGSSQLIAVPYSLYAERSGEKYSAGKGISITGNTISATSYSIGDFAYGGIVFYVDGSGQHGLVCAKTDASSGVRWYAGTHGFTHAKGDGLFAGKENTTIIIVAQVALGDDSSTYAARICNELKITEGGIQYGDWYLPSKEELNMMYINKTTIDSTATANGGNALVNAKYWSSTEFNINGAFTQNFTGGYQGTTNKGTTDRVRAVRKF
jgi:hypothetical protein